MTSAHLSWDLCRSFLAVVHEGSLSRAARALNLTQPTLGRHIAELEASLGVALFTRSQRGLVPTDAALELRPHAQAVASAADAFVRAAHASVAEVRGTVRITAPDMLAVEALPPILATFRARHPRVAIELAATTENLLQREADIAVRVVRPEQEALFAAPVGEIRFGLYAHPAYLQQYGTPRTVADLRAHTLVGFDRGGAAIRVLRELPDPLSREDFGFRSDNPIAQLAAIRGGIGIGRAPDAVARRYPAELTPVLVDQHQIVVRVWVVMHEDARSSPHIRAMFDHLASELRALLAGLAQSEPT